MPYEFTEEGRAMLADVTSFLDDHIYPNEAEYDEQSPHVLGYDHRPLPVGHELPPI